MSVTVAAPHDHHLVGGVEPIPQGAMGQGRVKLKHAEPEVCHVEPGLGTRGRGGDIVVHLRREWGGGGGGGGGGWIMEEGVRHQKPGTVIARTPEAV